MQKVHHHISRNTSTAKHRSESSSAYINMKKILYLKYIGIYMCCIMFDVDSIEVVKNISKYL